MRQDKLFQDAKEGDNRAYFDWSTIYQARMAQFGYQSGVGLHRLPEFQLEIFRRFQENLPDISEETAAESLLYKTAITCLPLFIEENSFTESGDALLRFEEDAETHRYLQELSSSRKIPFVLLHFHGKTLSEISLLLGETEEKLSLLINASKEFLKEKLQADNMAMAEKRLDLLNKSYGRFSVPFKENNLFEQNEQLPDLSIYQKAEPKKPVKRGAAAMLTVAGLFLAAVVGVSFFFNEQQDAVTETAAEEENPATVSKQMVKKWEAEYEAIRESAPERLGISAETFDQLEYVGEADELKKRTFSRQNVKLLKDDPERMQDQVKTLMLSIETPKGMLDSVKDYSLLMADVSPFLLIYTKKTDQLMAITDGLLEKHNDELASAEMNGELSPEKLTQSRADYPEEIEKLTAALDEYTFQFTVHPNENRFRTIRDIHQFYEIHPFNADMSASYYLDILGRAPYFDETGMLWPAEELPYSIIMMATFLSDPVSDPALAGEVEFLLQHNFFTLLKGDEDFEVFDRKGIVKEELQTAWKSLMQHNNNPLTFLMLPIIDEMEDSGWKESAHYDNLAYPDILSAVDMERNGELAAKLPNGNLEVKTENLQMEGYDYSDVKPLYEKFSAGHDRKILSGVEPMDILMLYHYANKIEDIETMWHLTADDELKPPLEVYTKGWKKKPEITETLQSMEIYADNVNRQGRKVYLMAIGQNLEYEGDYRLAQNNMLVTESDQIWLMQHQMDEFYSKENGFEAYNANVESFYGALANSSDLESVNAASPAEIAGVFLLALEKEDVKTMRLLVNEANDSIDDEEFKTRWVDSHLPDYSRVSEIFFRVDTYDMVSSGVRGSIDLIIDQENIENSQYMAMEKVGDTWMIGDMYGY